MAAVREVACERFRELDVNGDGRLDRGELLELGQWLWRSFHPNGVALTAVQKQVLAEQLLQRCGQPADGTLSQPVFVSWFIEQLAEIGRHHAKDAANVGGYAAAPSLTPDLARGHRLRGDGWAAAPGGYFVGQRVHHPMHGEGVVIELTRIEATETTACACSSTMVKPTATTRTPSTRSKSLTDRGDLGRRVGARSAATARGGRARCTCTGSGSSWSVDRRTWRRKRSSRASSAAGLSPWASRRRRRLLRPTPLLSRDHRPRPPSRKHRRWACCIASASESATRRTAKAW